MAAFRLGMLIEQIYRAGIVQSLSMFRETYELRWRADIVM